MLDNEQGEHQSSIVWTEHDDKVMGYDDKTFLAALNARFPDFYGEVTGNQKRYCYPLNFCHAFNYIKPRMLLIGDAAHGIHPIAGQGLNLGFRDIKALTNILAKNKNNDIGTMDILQQYQEARQKDNMTMAAATDLLNKTFSNGAPPLKLARKIGLKLVNRIKPAKKFFMRRAMGT
jgi:2-octaprenyl-6-methoxyphenol hydroxylase